MSNEKFEWSDLWTALKKGSNEWVRTTESMYFSMLSAVPPRLQTRDAFLIGGAGGVDRNGDPIYICFRRIGGEFSAKCMTIEEFQKALQQRSMHYCNSIQMMELEGGGFVSALAKLYYIADAPNRARLREGFAYYFDEYEKKFEALKSEIASQEPVEPVAA